MPNVKITNRVPADVLFLSTRLLSLTLGALLSLIPGPVLLLHVPQVKATKSGAQFST